MSLQKVQCAATSERAAEAETGIAKRLRTGGDADRNDEEGR
jgi:hypothetical protein